MLALHTIDLEAEMVVVEGVVRGVGIAQAGYGIAVVAGCWKAGHG